MARKKKPVVPVEPEAAPVHPDPTPSEIGRAMAALGASKGGKARANVLTLEQRREIARNAVRTRWEKAGKLKQPDGAGEAADQAAADAAEAPVKSGMPFSMFRGTLTIGDLTVTCHVLNDGRRVIAQREVVRILGHGREGGNLKPYLDGNPLIQRDSIMGETIQFRVPNVPIAANGFEGTLLIDLCVKFMEARRLGLLTRNQLPLVDQAEIVVRACAKVGIIALIDEATGYQKVREKNALQLKLQAFIADELQEWARMFPEEFWFELARLEGIHYSPNSRPLRWGKYVMMFVYDAIDGDVGKELRKINPNPHFLKNHHQWLKKYGRDKVTIQIEKVVTIMKLCLDMTEFKDKFAHVFKKTPLQMNFNDIRWLSTPAPGGTL